MLILAVQGHAVFRFVAVSALAGVLVLSFLPPDSVDPIRLPVDSVVDAGHVLTYAVLAASTMLSVPRQALTSWRTFGIVFTISLMGFAIELLQPLVGRTTNIADFAGNELGIAGGIAIFWGYLLLGGIGARDVNRRHGDG